MPWRNPAHDWDQYDAVYICTPWDYPQDPALFIEVLEAIDASSAHLINPLSLARWTLTKTYLRDLDERGGAVVPSVWCDAFDADEMPGWFDALGSDRIIVKPVIGTNSQHSFLLGRPVTPNQQRELAETFERRAFFVQPFLANVQGEGEYSLFYFNGEYSHAILKVPRRGDYRSQEEHGSEIRSVSASGRLRDAAQRILALVEPQPVYVRIDLVRDDADVFRLMELELIEPSLYLRTDAGAAGRFAQAFDTAWRRLDAG